MRRLMSSMALSMVFRAAISWQCNGGVMLQYRRYRGFLIIFFYFIFFKLILFIFIFYLYIQTISVFIERFVRVTGCDL